MNDDERLARLLDETLSGVQPTDRRESLRAALHPQESDMTTSPRPWTWMLAGAGLAAAVIVAVFALGGLGGSDDKTPVAGDPTSRATPEQSGDPQTQPTEATTDTGSSSAPASPSGGATVPAYFVVDTERAGPRLVREFRQVDGDPLTAAVDLAVAGEALDPDYRTLFPGGAVESVTYDEAAGQITVALEDDGWATPAAGMSRKDARLALQQVVYTAQGVVQKRVPVVFTHGGSPATVFGIDTASGLKAAPQLATLNHMSLTTPEQGAEVTDGTLKISGVGNSFEANVIWEIRRAGAAKPVQSGADMLQGDWMQDKLVPFEFTVDVGDLPPGDYTVRVSSDDPTGGTEGVGAMTDDKQFTIG